MPHYDKSSPPHEHRHLDERQDDYPHVQAAAQSNAVKDPVCGMTVDPAVTPRKTTHAGQQYFFCSPGCLAKFEAAPERYASKQPPPAPPSIRCSAGFCRRRLQPQRWRSPA